MNIIFLNNKIQACGVYQYGLRVANILKKSQKNDYIYVEIEDYSSYLNAINTYDHDLIIYNYHSSTMSWLNSNNIQHIVKNIGIPHESPSKLFDYIFSIDPDERENNNVFNIPRPIYDNVKEILSKYEIKNNKIKNFIDYKEEDTPIFGSFGFGFENKGFDKIVDIINQNYEKAIIKLVITLAHFDGDNYVNYKNISNLCNSKNINHNIKLLICNDFLTNEELLLFLSSNTCNIFLYDKMEARGISSVIDYAISVNKPFIISDSYMFRHIYRDDICVYKTNIKHAINNSIKILPDFTNKYSNKNLIDKFDKTISSINNIKSGIFYNSKKALCSIYESGLMVYNSLKQSTLYTLDYTEDQDFLFNYDFAIVNEHCTVNNWVTYNMIAQFDKHVFCVVTEVSFEYPFISKSPSYYTAYIVLDISIEDNTNIYSFGRPLEDYITPEYKEKNIPIIGSFGFATEGKKWEKIVEEVQNEFDEALIRINIPYATHVPDNQTRIHKVTMKCFNVLTKPNVKLEITNNNFSKEELIDWCSQNTINCFFYERDSIYDAGLWATTDQAIISERPLLVTGDKTFRHIHKYIDYYPNIKIKEAISKTTEGVKQMKNDWSSKNFCKKFESILSKYIDTTYKDKAYKDKFKSAISAYYYHENNNTNGDVINILYKLYKRYRRENTSTFVASNSTFFDTSYGIAKKLYINININNVVVTMVFNEDQIIYWSDLDNIINLTNINNNTDKITKIDNQCITNTIEVSIGEIVDKYSILEIKSKYIKDDKKIREIEKEMNVLEKLVCKIKQSYFYKLLLFINERIWNDTDTIKLLSIDNTDLINISKFSELSNKIFENNQKRFRLKKYFNILENSNIKEQKSYNDSKCFIEISNDEEIYNKISEINYLCISYDLIYIDSKFKNIINDLFHNPNIEFIEITTLVINECKLFKLNTYSIEDSLKDIFDFLPIKYISGGKFGDFLNQLSVVAENYYKTGRKGILYIYELSEQCDKFMFGLEKTYDDTYNIIKKLNFVKDYRIYDNDDYDENISNWRINLKIDNWYNVYTKKFNIPWGKHKWLTGNYDSQWFNKIIFNITPQRFISSNVINILRSIITQNIDNCIFISQEEDYYNHFSKEVNINIPFHKPNNFDESVTIVNSCKMAYLGFSSMAVIANALHKKHILIGKNGIDMDLNNLKGIIPHVIDVLV